RLLTLLLVGVRRRRRSLARLLLFLLRFVLRLGFVVFLLLLIFLISRLALGLLILGLLLVFLLLLALTLLLLLILLFLLLLFLLFLLFLLLVLLLILLVLFVLFILFVLPLRRGGRGGLFLFFILQFFDLPLHVIVIVLRFLVLRVELERLLIMIERVCPVAELFIIALLCFATLIKCVSKVIMAFALQSGIPGKQCLAK